MARMVTKTRERVQWLKDQYEAGLNDKIELSKLFMAKFNTKPHAFYTCWSYFINGKSDRTARDTILNYNAAPKTMAVIGSTTSCYFGGIGKLIPHHISYNPEIVVFVTEQNHSRLHAIIKEYHKAILTKDAEITILQKKIKTLKAVLE